MRVQYGFHHQIHLFTIIVVFASITSVAHAADGSYPRYEVSPCQIRVVDESQPQSCPEGFANLTLALVSAGGRGRTIYSSGPCKTRRMHVEQIYQMLLKAENERNLITVDSGQFNNTTNPTTMIFENSGSVDKTGSCKLARMCYSGAEH